MGALPFITDTVALRCGNGPFFFGSEGQRLLISTFLVVWRFRGVLGCVSVVPSPAETFDVTMFSRDFFFHVENGSCSKTTFLSTIQIQVKTKSEIWLGISGGTI